MITAPAELLASLYGEKVARSLFPRLEDFLTRGRTTALARSQSSGRTTLTEQDSLLITYADQVREPGVTPLRTLGTFAERHLVGVVSGIHILPFYPWTSDDGFSVKDFFAVDPAYGTWDDVQRIGENFDLMFDAVFNHLSAQSEWFIRFLADDPACQDFFVTVEGDPDLSLVIRPRALPLLTEFATPSGPRKVWTTFSADQVDLNFRNPEVLFVTLAALQFYVNQGARFIRLDAIAFLWKEIGTSCLHLRQTHQVVQFLRSVLAEVAPAVCLITETNVPHADNLSYFGDGTNEAQLVYNFALPPLVLHSFATGSAAQLTHWAKTLRLPSDQATFFNFLASHDGIGVNPARGILSDSEIDNLIARTVAHGGFISYKHLPDGSKTPYEMNINFFDALSNPARGESLELQISRSLCAHAIQLALIGVPGIYFHSLFGSRSDRAGAEISGIPRRINREKLELERLETELADLPSVRARVFDGFRALLKTRAAHTAFSPAGSQRVLELNDYVFVVERTSPNGQDRVVCFHNVSEREVSVSGPTGSCRLPGYGFRWIPGPSITPA